MNAEPNITTGEVLCDTNILIEHYRSNVAITAALTAIGRRRWAISDVTRAELRFGSG
jgi:predicted nucleic acid-binding protein